MYYPSHSIHLVLKDDLNYEYRVVNNEMRPQFVANQSICYLS